MDAIILSHRTALDAVLRVRYLYSRIPWEPLSAKEQMDVQMSARIGRGPVDREYLKGLYLLGGQNDPIDILVGSPSNRARRGGVTCRLVSRSLPPGSILKVANGVYCVSPEAALLQCAGDFSFPELFTLMMELLGTYALARHEVGSFDRMVKYGCEPSVSLGSLKAMAAFGKDNKSYIYRACIPHLRERSASPMESIIFAMLGLPHRYGGFGCCGLPGGMLLNHRIDFNDSSRRLSSQMPYAICDCYIPAAKIDLEYNGFYHEEQNARLHDGNRNNGLKGMGITVFVINREQAQDLTALEEMARLIHSCASVQFRYRVGDYYCRQRNLLFGLRRAVGLEH